ncbi:MAG: Extracellular solute-binding protein family 5 [Candidatus Woesebacteria bacterium GW2011_GWB1_45_5]|uniref:Extracellular solute-binding protein family 5 n=1 Tax=Candidatus Woesebacteria bacterium GW2011_GWB1_45_5 TaxID=1618581 RepID=A0A0G1QLE4_9BACT|nr:MAG: Extracellular solute-binding protein family 5 [Candidatus Woesebacteria bacterium GW2011_GWB1_45_5]
MLNLRYISRLIAAFLTRFRAIILIFIILGIAFFFVLRFLLPTLSGETTRRVGVTGRYTTLTLPTRILEMVGDGLTKLDESGNVEPNLASSWETPDKGKSWIFTLRDGPTWQDEKPVISSTINYEFSDVTIERPDDKTLIFKLQNTYSAFPSVVARPTFKKGLLGTGEWQVKKLSVNGSYVGQMTLQNKDGLRIIYKFYPTEERTKLAFKLGEIDETENILDPVPFDSWKTVDITKSVSMGEHVALFFNTQDKYLGEKSMRQALAYAIDKDALGGERAISPVSVSSWAYNSQVKPYTYDKDKALDSVNELKENMKTDDIVVNLSTSPALLTQAEKIAKDWEAVGVKANLQVLSNIPTDYQALLAVFDIPEDPDQYSVWHSTQTATNITHYQSPRIDKLLEDGRSEIDTEARRKIYLDFQRFLVEDSPAVFLYYPTTYKINRK